MERSFSLVFIQKKEINGIKSGNPTELWHGENKLKLVRISSDKGLRQYQTKRKRLEPYWIQPEFVLILDVRISLFLLSTFSLSGTNLVTVGGKQSYMGTD
ncbi:hypothetical protein J6TS1_02680 [Siminovitchia terrae]|uniref:Uncharacterized protein n=1 Tax=Siminovitchia terrae TaxID=1914933 RepID=A0ABQ4KQT6_SIMTE|nr:hypothetical protein J6TS1_02680 [Siminovitchia terrae]